MGSVWSALLSRIPVKSLLSILKQFQSALMRQLQNQILMGGAVVAVAGLVTSSVWKLWWWLSAAVHDRLFTTIEIASRSTSFTPFLRWLQSQPAAWNSSHLCVQRVRSSGKTAEDDEVFTFLPAQNASVRLWYRGRVLWVTTLCQNDSLTNSSTMKRLGLSKGHKPTSTRGPGRDRSGTGGAGFAVTIFGKDKSVITELLREGQSLRRHEANRLTEVFATQQSQVRRNGASSSVLRWFKVGQRPCRSISSVILPHRGAESILADCKEFLAAETWYADRGIPYRRGYLLEGLPGTGKTSLINALAGSLRLPIYMLSLSTAGLSDDVLLQLLHETDPRCLLVLEDVDAVFAGVTGAQRRRIIQAGPRASVTHLEEDDQVTSPLTFAGLLNAIDGVAAQQGRLLFMTTNHIERLDPALIRPGRVDFQLHFGCATQVQAERLFVRFFENERDTDCHDGTLPTNSQECEPGTPDVRQAHFQGNLMTTAKQFAARIPASSKTMAELQGYLMAFRKKPALALASVQDLLDGKASFFTELLSKPQFHRGSSSDNGGSTLQTGARARGKGGSGSRRQDQDRQHDADWAVLPSP